MNMKFHPNNRLAPCPCDDTEHNWTQEQRQDLARRLDSAERYGLTDSTRILRERLAPCPAYWRHIP